MGDKIFITYSGVEEDEFVVRGEYKNFDFKLQYLGFQLHKSQSIFKLTFSLDYDSEFEISKLFEKEYVLKRFGNLDNFLQTELGKIIEEIEIKPRIKREVR